MGGSIDDERTLNPAPSTGWKASRLSNSSPLKRSPAPPFAGGEDGWGVASTTGILSEPGYRRRLASFGRRDNFTGLLVRIPGRMLLTRPSVSWYQSCAVASPSRYKSCLD